jgi:hypothetical protein
MKDFQSNFYSPILVGNFNQALNVAYNLKSGEKTGVLFEADNVQCFPTVTVQTRINGAANPCTASIVFVVENERKIEKEIGKFIEPHQGPVFLVGNVRKIYVQSKEDGTDGCSGDLTLILSYCGVNNCKTDHQDEDNSKAKNQFDSLKSSYLSEQEIKSINSWISKVKNKNNIKDSKERTAHIEKAIITLQLKYEIIGNGKNRIVYDLENGYVLKVALNNWGMKSNKKEYKLFNNSPSQLRKYLCPVMEFGNGWIIMEKMTEKVPTDNEYDIKFSQFIKVFKENGIEPRDIKDKNLALSENGEFVAIDYGNFVVTGE